MRKGSTVTCRPVRDTDLSDQRNTYHVDIGNRGDFFPRGTPSLSGSRLYRQRPQPDLFYERGRD
jgi:hypothetical protein